MRKILTTALILGALLMLSGLALKALADDTKGTVLTCRDGDTCKIQMLGDVYSVRIKDIDAPELKQDYGPQARDYLNSLVEGQKVRLTCGKFSNFFRRYNCALVVKDVNVSEAMVREGLAWDYTQFSKGRYKALEDEARAARLGLWQQEHPTTPYCFRHKRKPVCKL